MKTAAENLVIMGRIAAPYGVLGWLKVLPDTELLDGLLEYDTWLIGKDTHWREVKLKTGKIHNDVLLVKLIGIDDREAAFVCKGMQVAVSRSLLPKLDHGEYYWSDLIGLSVINLQGVDFGIITDVFETGANDVIVVQGKDERLIPYTEQTIIEVSVEKRTMIVDWDEDY